MRRIDLRSDTITTPSEEIRLALSSTSIGDEIYGEDINVFDLEERMATMFGKESALFFPTGTMCNLAAVMAWCSVRSSEIIVGNQSHMFLFEQAGVTQFGGVSQRAVPNLHDGTMDLHQIRCSIRDNHLHEPHTTLICIENTHSACGGKVLPINYLAQLSSLAQAHSLPIHLDGARIWNALTKLKKKPIQIGRFVDSLSVCLSKSLGSPIGSVLLGPEAFIEKARKIRSSLGGSMRQIGLMAAAGIVALDEYEKETECFIEKDHERMQLLASSITHATAFKIDVPQTNILLMEILLYDKRWHEHMISVKVSDMLKEKGVLVCAWSTRKLRLVMHKTISNEDIQYTIQAIEDVSNKLEQHATFMYKLMKILLFWKTFFMTTFQRMQPFHKS